MSPSTRLSAIPDGSRHLSEGLIVEARLVARLIGIRLLTIDAELIVSPAEMRNVRAAAGDLTVGPPSATALAAPPLRSRPIGAGLATAEQLIDEGAAALAASRTGLDTGTRTPRPEVDPGAG
jgi:hypothetical protein